MTMPSFDLEFLATYLCMTNTIKIEARLLDKRLSSKGRVTFGLAKYDYTRYRSFEEFCKHAYP